MSPAEQPAAARTPAEGGRDLVAMLAGTLIAAAALLLSFHGKSTRFEDLGLGKETVPVFARVGDDPIHCTDLGDLDACLNGFHRRGAEQAALWLGNSQLHGVNQWQAGQATASALLFPRLNEEGVHLITLSQPNANFQEHLVLYAHLATRLPLRYLLLPAVFDDTRETGVRGTIATALEDPATRAVLEVSEIGRSIIASNRSTADPDLAALDATLQEGSESWLNAWLDRHFPLWKLRPEARGNIGRFVQQTRNAVFGITPNSKRRVITGRYAQNLAAARAILADAKARGIRTLVYVAPLRNDVETPYVPSEYERFKRDVAELSAAHAAQFVNLESSVPGPLWGVTHARDLDEANTVDFMHFQAGGHAILADQLASALFLRGNGASR
jgi:hypothetical protein